MLSTHIRTAINSLYTAKQRTLLALIGIGIGIGSVIAMVSIGVIYSEDTMRQYKELGTNIVRIKKSREENEENNRVKIPLKETLELPYSISNIMTVAPIMPGWWHNYHFAGKQGDANLVGVTESFKDLYQLHLKEGRFISDLDKNQPYVVVGQNVLTDDIFSSFNSKLIGSQVKIERRIYTIIGVLEPAPNSVFSPYFSKYMIDWSFIMPISTAQRYLENKDIHSVTVRLKQDADHSLVARQVKQYFAKRVKGLQVETEIAKKLIAQKEKQAQMLTLLLGAIGSISMLVAGVGIMNVMLTSVIERRREIGILRAIGARQRDIQWQFLTEAVILSLVGGAFGIALGIGAAYLFAWFKGLQFIISSMAIILGVGVSLGVGSFFGFYPAYKAAKLDPIMALR
jgi:putative ABC transport system permease protein